MFDKKNYDFNISVKPISKEMAEELNSTRYRVVVFGSARVKADDNLYQEVVNFAKKIGEAGFDLITGGGPGLMEAGNLGHKLSGNKSVKSIGLNIRLPHEQKANPNLDIVETHERFSTRLEQFMLLSNVIIVTPGGIGTCLELFYTWQLLQVHQVCRMPIVLVGKMWRPLIEWVRNEPLQYGYLDKSDMDFVTVVDDFDEAFELLKQSHKKFDMSKCLA